MLSPLALPCFPNHDVVYTMMSSASVSIEAEWRLSVNNHHPSSIIIIIIVRFDPTWFLFSVHGCKGRYLTYLINWAGGLSFYGSQSSLFFFLRPASSLDLALDAQYNIKQYNQIDFIHISNILLQDSEKRWRNNVLHRIWSQSWSTSRAVGGRKWLRPLEYEETNNHERSTWRLRTPTICRRSVPT